MDILVILSAVFMLAIGFLMLVKGADWFVDGAAGLAAMKYFQQNKIVEDVERKGAMYESLLQDHPAVKEIRRAGLLLAVELGESEKLYKIMDHFIEEGILSDWFLFCDTAFRISPPLIISDDEIRDSVSMIRRCLDRL